MPTYGGGDPAGIALYDGESDHNPEITDMVRAIYAFLGLEGGNVLQPGTSYMPRWLEDLFGNRLPTAVEMAAGWRAAVDFGGGGFVTPAGWLAYGTSIGEYWRNTHAAVTGSQDPRLTTGGGGALALDDKSPALLATRAQDIGVAQPLTYDELLSIQETVWGIQLFEQDPLYGQGFSSAQSMLIGLYNDSLGRAAYAGIPIPGAAHMRAYFVTPGVQVQYFGSPTLVGAATLPRGVDLAEALPDETLLEFLLRSQSLFAWGTTGPWEAAPADYVWARDPNNYDIWYRCDIARQSWAALLAAQTPLSIPVRFPGVDEVTFGTPVDFTESGFAALEGDGLLIEITAHGPGQGQQPAGDLTLWRFTGWIALEVGGSFEGLQWLGLDRMIVVPHSGKAVHGAAVYLKPGVHITATPWTAA